MAGVPAEDLPEQWPARWPEALVRWRHPQRGELAPDLFIPLAEQTELLSALTSWVTDKAIAG